VPTPLSLRLTAAAVVIAATAAAQVRRFDMGSASSPLAAGFTAVTATTVYSAAAGFGWTAGAPAEFAQTAILPAIPVVVDAALIRDGVDGYGDLTFRVDVPNGTWHCVAWLGNVGSSLRPAPREGLDVTASGVAVATDVAVRTLAMKASFANALGGYRRVPFLATATAGRIDLLFHCDGSGASKNSILGLELWPHVPAPIAFDHASGLLVADPPHAAALAPALAAFNAGDYASARSAFAALADARLRAWGRAWLLGWMTGDEVAVDLSLLAWARADLQGLAAPNDPTVALLLQELSLLERADFYDRARGYTAAAVPGGLGSLLQNLCGAGLLFEQFRGDVLDAAAAPFLPQSPLAAKARFLLARNMHSRNTLVNDPTNPFTAAFLAIFQQLWNRRALFPRGDEARVLGFLGSAYAVPGGIVSNWAGPSSVPPIVPANTWWAPFVAAARDPTAPNWANQQRQYHRAFRNCGEWWMTRRLIAGEIGGGDGDDVEGAGLLGLPSVAVREGGHLLENGVALVLDKVLYGPSMTPAEGYFTNCGDVEHSAEFSTNPLYILLFANYGDPRWVEYALRTLRNLDDQWDAMPWTLPDGQGGRHFRAYNLGANTFCGPSLDIPLCMRAAVPGFAIGDYAAHPRVLTVFDELARAWAGHAVSTAQGKPAGVFPAAVNPSPPYVFGTGGQWWANAGYVDLAGGPQYHAYLYALMLSAYAHSQAPDRHVLLEPLRQAGLFLHGYLTGTVTGTAAGTPGWAANLLKGVIADAVARARGLMIADANLALSAADLAKIDLAIGAYASPFEKHIALPVAGTKSKTAFETTFGNAAVWISNFWPLATTAVSYTDRIFLMTGGSHGSLFGTLTGASTWGILPPSVISWTNPAPALGELDFAALVNDLQPSGLDVLLFNYMGQGRDFGLRLWRTLPAGQYEARIGADANHDDAMDGPPHTVVPFVLANPGLTVVLPGVPAGVLQKIEIRRLLPGAGAPTLLPDPALAARDIAFGAGGAIAVTVHNLGSAPVLGAVVELVQNAVVVSSAAVPALQPPLDYRSKTALVNVCCGAFVPGAALTVRIALPPGTAQVTPENDAVTVSPPGWVAVGSGCAGAAGVPSLTLTSPPALGGTYALAAQNLAAGLAVIVTGFGPQSVPLQPLGLGFAPGCTLLVTTEAAAFLPQAGGSAAWSLPIPNDASLAGVHLWSQVGELGTPSAVSNACHAEVH